MFVRLSFLPSRKDGTKDIFSGSRLTETPPPCHLLGKHPSKDGANRVGNRDYSASEPLKFASVLQRDDIRYNNHRQSKNTTTSEALDSAEDDELDHRLGESARQRAEQEDGETAEEDDLAPENVGQAAIDWLQGRRGEHVCRADPSSDAGLVEDSAESGKCGCDTGGGVSFYCPNIIIIISLAATFRTPLSFPPPTQHTTLLTWFGPITSRRGHS